MFIGLKLQIKLAWKVALEILFPAFCIGCKKEGSFFCDKCLESLPLSERGFENAPNGSALNGLLSCCIYQEKSMLPKIIHAFKYDFITDLAEPLAHLMIESLKNSPTEAVLCAVPLHKRRHKWRGFNQSDLLATRISDASGYPKSPLLKRVAFSKPQMELSREQRLKNTENAFIFADDAARDPPKTVILVDDVATTLSTLESCAKILKDNGVRHVYGIVLARVY